MYSFLIVMLMVDSHICFMETSSLDILLKYHLWPTKGKKSHTDLEHDRVNDAMH